MLHQHLEKELTNSFLEVGSEGLGASSIKVLVIDDHALVRAAIHHALVNQPEVEIVVLAQDYAEAESKAAGLHPDIIFLDMHIAHYDCITEIPRLRKFSPNSRIVVLTDVEDEQEAFAAVMAGALGYRSKQDVDTDELIAMIQAICREELVLRPALLTRLLQRLRNAALPLWDSEKGDSSRALHDGTVLNRLTDLTTREREILQLISQGYRDRDIADGLHISEKTVQKHVQSILSKLGAQNRTEAAYYVHLQRPQEDF